MPFYSKYSGKFYVTWNYLILFAITIIMFFPIYWLIISSFKPLIRLFSPITEYLPYHPTLDNYRNMILETDFPLYFLNSIIVALGVIVTTVTASTLAGYGLARLKIRGQGSLAKVILISYMFSPIMLAIPIYIIYRKIGLLNSFIGIILAQTSITLPFSVWLMWKFFLSIPITFEEAAWMDGASRFRAFLEVAVPMTLPGIVANAIYSFAVSWGDFTMAKILLTGEKMWTLPPGILTFVDQHTVDWGMIMSASVTISLPIFIIVYTLQKYLLLGFKVGEVK